MPLRLFLDELLNVDSRVVSWPVQNGRSVLSNNKVTFLSLEPLHFLRNKNLIRRRSSALIKNLPHVLETAVR